MSIEQPKIIDFISINPSTNDVILSISDHLTWELGDSHLLLLQEKLNNYLAFIESGEILQSYPEVKSRSIVIDVVCEHSVSERGKEFFDKAASIVNDAGLRLTYQVLSG